jgi:hypothetical protein
MFARYCKDDNAWRAGNHQLPKEARVRGRTKTCTEWVQCNRRFRFHAFVKPEIAENAQALASSGKTWCCRCAHKNDFLTAPFNARTTIRDQSSRRMLLGDEVLLCTGDWQLHAQLCPHESACNCVSKARACMSKARGCGTRIMTAARE